MMGSAPVKLYQAQSGTCPTWRWAPKITACPFNANFHFFQAEIEPAAFCACANIPPNRLSTHHSTRPFKFHPLSEGSCTLLKPSSACSKGPFLFFLFLLLLLYHPKEKPNTYSYWFGSGPFSFLTWVLVAQSTHCFVTPVRKPTLCHTYFKIIVTPFSLVVLRITWNKSYQALGTQNNILNTQ